jgi:hypothetical protein
MLFFSWDPLEPPHTKNVVEASVFCSAREGDRRTTWPESLVEASRLRLDSDLKTLRRRLASRHYGAEDLIFRVHAPCSYGAAR